MGSYEGSVVAADAWGARQEDMTVPPGKVGNYEHVFHRDCDRDWLLLTGDLRERSALAQPRGHRAIGVVYHPDREAGNYVPTMLPDRYDAFLHLDETRALHPLDVHPEKAGVPELYPWGL